MRKNLSKIQEKMKRLQRQLKEAERAFYMELGREFEKAIINPNCTVDELKSIFEKVKKDFGR